MSSNSVSELAQKANLRREQLIRRLVTSKEEGRYQAAHELLGDHPTLDELMMVIRHCGEDGQIRFEAESLLDVQVSQAVSFRGRSLASLLDEYPEMGERFWDQYLQRLSEREIDHLSDSSLWFVDHCPHDGLRFREIERIALRFFLYRPSIAILKRLNPEAKEYALELIFSREPSITQLRLLLDIPEAAQRASKLLEEAGYYALVEEEVKQPVVKRKAESWIIQILRSIAECLGRLFR